MSILGNGNNSGWLAFGAMMLSMLGNRSSGSVGSGSPFYNNNGSYFNYGQMLPNGSWLNGGFNNNQGNWDNGYGGIDAFNGGGIPGLGGGGLPFGAGNGLGNGGIPGLGGLPLGAGNGLAGGSFGGPLGGAKQQLQQYAKALELQVRKLDNMIKMLSALDSKNVENADKGIQGTFSGKGGGTVMSAIYSLTTLPQLQSVTEQHQNAQQALVRVTSQLQSIEAQESFMNGGSNVS